MQIFDRRRVQNDRGGIHFLQVQSIRICVYYIVFGIFISDYKLLTNINQQKLSSIKFYWTDIKKYE